MSTAAASVEPTAASSHPLHSGPSPASAPPAPSGVRMYADAWQSVFSFLSLSCLTAALTVSREWHQIIAARMPCLHFACSMMYQHWSGEMDADRESLHWRSGGVLLEEILRSCLVRHVTRLSMLDRNCTYELMHQLADGWPHLELLETTLAAAEIEALVNDPDGSKAAAAEAEKEERMKIAAEREEQEQDEEEPASANTHSSTSDGEESPLASDADDDDALRVPSPLLSPPWGYSAWPSYSAALSWVPPALELLPPVRLSAWPRPARLHTLRFSISDPACFHKPALRGENFGRALATLFPADTQLPASSLTLSIRTVTHADACEWMQVCTHMLRHLPHLTEFDFSFGNNNWTRVRPEFIRALGWLPRLQWLRYTDDGGPAAVGFVGAQETANAHSIQPLQHLAVSAHVGSDCSRLVRWSQTLRSVYLSFHPSLAAVLPRLPLLEKFHLGYSNGQISPSERMELVRSITECLRLTSIDLAALTLPSAALSLVLQLPRLRTLRITLGCLNFSLAPFAAPSAAHLRETLVVLSVRIEFADPRAARSLLRLQPLKELPHLFALQKLQQLTCNFGTINVLRPTDVAAVSPSAAELAAASPNDRAQLLKAADASWRAHLKQVHQDAEQQLQQRLPWIKRIVFQ